MDHPIEISPLTKKKPENPEYTERFEFFMNGWEMANAYSELNDPIDQRERFKAQEEAFAAGDEEANHTDEDFLNALERIPSIIDQYKAKNEVLEMEIPQLQEIAGKVWKKEDELKQLKSELAALDRKIQLELAPPTPEVAEKENEGQQLKPEAEDVRNRQAQYPENAPPQIRSPANERSNFIADHIIIGRPGLYAKDENRPKVMKI